MNINELLTTFDEIGFAPTTLCENPDEYAIEWKRQLVAEIERLKAENEKVYAVRDNLLKENDELIKTNAELLLLPKQAVKQAKIDVLNELKKKIHDTRLNDDTAEIIIEMIEELKKCQR